MNLLDQQKNEIIQILMSDPATKDILKKAIDTIVFDSPYKRACAKLGKVPIPELSDKSDADVVWADSAMRLAICVKAKNMIPQEDGSFKVWTPKYGVGESHYSPVPDMSSPGFSYDTYVSWRSITWVGARLEYRSSQLAKEGFEEFNEYYKIHMMPPDSE